MADFSALIAQIEAYVKQNGNNEITGNGLQSILVGMVNALGTVAITALQGDLADEVTARTNADGAINAKIPAEASSSNKLADKAFVTGLTTALQNAVSAIKADIENGYVYAGIATPSGTPVSGKMFYLARQAGTYTNFGGLTLTEGVNVLKYNGTAWSQEQLISIADIYNNPLMGYYECDTAGGTAAKTVAATGYVLPTTGGSVKIKMANRNTVANATLNINSTGAKPLYYNGQRAGVGNTWDTNETVVVYYDGTNYQAYNVKGSNGDGVFDISAYNLTDGQPTPYVELAAALGTNGEHVPQSLRKGGISIKFIQGSVPSSDNKYVQYRLMSDTFNTTEANWQGVADKPVGASEDLVTGRGILKSYIENTGEPYTLSWHTQDDVLATDRIVVGDGIMLVSDIKGVAFVLRSYDEDNNQTSWGIFNECLIIDESVITNGDKLAKVEISPLYETNIKAYRRHSSSERINLAKNYNPILEGFFTRDNLLTVSGNRVNSEWLKTSDIEYVTALKPLTQAVTAQYSNDKSTVATEDTWTSLPYTSIRTQYTWVKFIFKTELQSKEEIFIKFNKDRIDDIINRFKHIEYTGQDFENKTVGTDGAISSASNRLLSTLIEVRKGDTIECPSGYKLFKIEYDSQKEYVSSIYANSTKFIVDWDGYTRIMFRKNDNGDFTPSDFTGKVVHFTTVIDKEITYRLTDAIFAKDTVNWTVGGYFPDGHTDSSTNRIHTNFIKVLKGNTVYPNAGYGCFVFRYDLKGNFIEQSAYLNGNNKAVWECPAAGYIVVLGRNSGNTNIPTSDGTNFVIDSTYIADNIGCLEYNQIIDQRINRSIGYKADYSTVLTNILKNTKIISDLGAQKLTFDSYVRCKGEKIYVAYLADETTTYESFENNTTYLEVIRIDVGSGEKEILGKFNCNSNVLGFQVGNRALYDPCVACTETYVYVYTVAYWPDGSNYSLIMLRYNMNTSEWENHIVCKLHYGNTAVDWTSTAMDDFYTSQGVQTTGNVEYPVFTGKIARYNNEYYATASQAVKTYPSNTPGFIVKSTNLIDWYIVTMYPTSFELTNNYESCLDIVDGKAYCIIRQNGGVPAIKMAVYDIVNDSWGDIVNVSGGKSSKPWIEYFYGKLIIFFNTGSFVGMDLTSVDRGLAKICEVNPETLEITELFNIESDEGVSYPTFHRELNTLYMTFQSDRRHKANSRSDIRLAVIGEYFRMY